MLLNDVKKSMPSDTRYSPLYSQIRSRDYNFQHTIFFCTYPSVTGAQFLDRHLVMPARAISFTSASGKYNRTRKIRNRKKSTLIKSIRFLVSAYPRTKKSYRFDCPRNIKQSRLDFIAQSAECDVPFRIRLQTSQISRLN